MMRRWLAVGSWVGCLLLAVPTSVLLVVGSTRRTPPDGFGLTGLGGAAFVAASLAFATTGAVIVLRVRRNPIGGIFCLIGLLLSVGVLTYEYADWALFIAAGDQPGGRLAAVLQNLTLPPAFGLLGLVLLLFPDGSPLSRTWAPALAVAVAGSTCSAAGYAFRPGVLDFPFRSVTNPVGMGSGSAWGSVANIGWMLMSLSVALAAASLLARRRRASAVERRQLAWVGLAAALAGAVMVANVLSFMLSIPGLAHIRLVVLGLTFAAFPIAASVAILRYRLYEIDRIVNRAAVYIVLSALLVGAYAAGVFLFGLLLQPLTHKSDLAVAGSTLLVAALFQPARRHIQAVVDRRFYRRRYDARLAVESFARRLRETVELPSVERELTSVVADTVQPASVTLWLRGQS